MSVERDNIRNLLSKCDAIDTEAGATGVEPRLWIDGQHIPTLYIRRVLHCVAPTVAPWVPIRDPDVPEQ